MLQGLAIIIFLFVSFVISLRFFGKPPKRLTPPKDSDHFANSKFFYPWDSGRPKMGSKELMKWKLESKNIPWPESFPEDFVIKQKPPLDKINYIQFINHATTLIDLNSVRFITDPHFSLKAGPLGIAGPKRRHAPPFLIEDIKKLDFVLLSHNHYDHLDLPSLKKIQKLYRPTFIVPHSNAGYLIGIGIPKKNIVELDWWENFSDRKIKITLTPAQHWSKRRLYDQNFALWGSFVIESLENKKRIYYAGDSGYAGHFKTIHEKWDSFDMSLIPVGAYEPRWFMKYHHMNPEEAVLTHLDIHSQKSVGIHHSCFKLTDEGWDHPKTSLKEALSKYHIPNENFIYPRPGELTFF
jgi:L-ascorbate metabolism protein UlaG (beta-lactamase superfamily)